MSGLDKDTRIFIEEAIDDALADPNIISEFKRYLLEMGIEPNLETILSYITGMIMGLAIGQLPIIRIKQGKPIKIPKDERTFFLSAASELLTRRAMELRQHLVKSEYM